MTIAAIMQPTYLPWLGYFAMMAEVDVFVFLDSVQFERRSWQQRNRVKGPNGAHMLTVPVLSKGASNQRIDDVVLEPGSDFRRRHVATMLHFYGRSRYFGEASPLLFPLIEQPTEGLADYTIGIATAIAHALDINPRFVRSRDLQARGSKADLLAAICCEMGADRYISALGSADYLAGSDAFRSVNVEVLYNTFQIFPYGQPHGDFISHLSVVDALFSIGLDATRAAIESGRHLTPAAQLQGEGFVA